MQPGDRVATLLWNQPEHLELYVAVAGMGAVVHTLNPRLHPDELAFIAADADDTVVVVDETLLSVLDSFADGHRFDAVVVVTHDDAAPEGMVDYEHLVAQSEPLAWPALDEGQAAAMCYTSGTTGRPKGVVYSHRALVLHSLTAALPDALSVGSRDTILPVVPMFHANAWGLPYAALMTGADLVLPGSAARRAEHPRAAGVRAGHDDRRRADGVDGDPRRARRRARSAGRSTRSTRSWSAERRCRRR